MGGMKFNTTGINRMDYQAKSLLHDAHNSIESEGFLRYAIVAITVAVTLLSINANSMYAQERLIVFRSDTELSAANKLNINESQIFIT